MKQKIYQKFNNLSPISAKILKYGMFISCVIIVSAFVLYFKNAHSASYSISKKEISFLMAESSIAIAAESIIGGLLFDYFSKR